MTDKTPREQNGELRDVEEIAPASKRPTDGQAAHGGDQAGPGSDEAGRPIAPQTGDPHDHSH